MIRIDSVHPMEEYLDLLQQSLSIYIDYNKLQDAFFDANYKTQDLYELARMWLRIESAGVFATLNPDTIIQFLEMIGVDLEKRYANRKTKNKSLDMARVITPLINNGIAVEFLTAYKEYKSFSSYKSFLQKLTMQGELAYQKWNGHNVLRYDTHLEERDNLRVYYRDIAVVSVPKLYSDIITGPSERHHLAWCDYPQADWRFAYNLFIRDAQNEQVMRQCTDAYEGLARLVEGDDFDLDTFRDKRTEYKTHCLKVFYNSRDNAPIPSAIREFFNACPKYRKLLFDLSVLYKFGLPIPCTSYFGYEQYIPEASYPDAFYSKALNTPIQTFTSHIVNETVMRILDMFWSLGYTKDDINVYYVRHDEIIFSFTDNILKDAWIFKECSDIYVPGFTPIHLDFYFGNYYQQVDPQLTAEIEHAIETADHRYEVFGGEQARDYHPMPSVEHVNVRFFEAEQGLEARVYNYRTEEHRSFMLESSNMEDALYELLETELIDVLHTPRYLLVYTQGLEFIEHFEKEGTEGTLVKVMSRYDTNIPSSR